MRSMVDICAAAPARTLEDLERSTEQWGLNDATENDTNRSLNWTSRLVRRQPRSSLHRIKGKNNLETEGVLRKEDCTQGQEQSNGDKIKYRHSASTSCSEEETHEMQHDTTATETEITIETLAEISHSDSETMQVPTVDDALKPRQLGFPAHTVKSRMARKRKKNGLSNLVLLWDVSTPGDSTQNDDNHEVDFESWEPLNPQDFTLIDTSADYERELQQKLTSSGGHELESLQQRILGDFPNNATKIIAKNHNCSDSFLNGKPNNVIALDKKSFHEAQKKQKLSLIDFTSSDATIENVEEHGREGHSSCTPRQKRLFPKIKSLLTLVATTKNMDEGNTEKKSDQRTLDLELPSVITNSQDFLISKESNHAMCVKHLENDALVCENTGILNGDSCKAGELQSSNGVTATRKLVDGCQDKKAETSILLASCPEKEIRHFIDENNFNDGDLNTLQGMAGFLPKSVAHAYGCESNENAENMTNTYHVTTMTPSVDPVGMGYANGSTNLLPKLSVRSDDAASDDLPAVDSIMKPTCEKNEIFVTDTAIANDCLMARTSADSAARSGIEDKARTPSSTCSDSFHILGVSGVKRQRIDTFSDKLKNKAISNRECFETQYVSVGMQSLFDRQEICREEPIFRKPNISAYAQNNISTPNLSIQTGRNTENCERGYFQGVIASELGQMMRPMSQNFDSCFPRDKFSTPNEKLSTTANLLSDFAGYTENTFNHVKDSLQNKSSIPDQLRNRNRVGNAVQQKSRDFHEIHYLDLTAKDHINNLSMNGQPPAQPFYVQNSFTAMKGIMPNILSEHQVNAACLNSRQNYSSEPTAMASNLGAYNSADCNSDQGVVHIFGNPVFKLMGQNVIVTNDKIKSYDNPHGQNGVKRFHSSGIPLENYLHYPQSSPQTVQSLFSSNHEVGKATGYSFMGSRQSHLYDFPVTNISLADLSVNRKDVATANSHISGLVSSERATVVSSMSQSLMDKYKSTPVNKRPVEVFGYSMGNNSIDTQQNRIQLTPVSHSQSWPWNELHSLNQMQLKTSAYPTETPDRGFI